MIAEFSGRALTPQAPHSLSNDLAGHEADDDRGVVHPTSLHYVIAVRESTRNRTLYEFLVKRNSCNSRDRRTENDLLNDGWLLVLLCRLCRATEQSHQHGSLDHLPRRATPERLNANSYAAGWAVVRR